MSDFDAEVWDMMRRLGQLEADMAEVRSQLAAERARAERAERERDEARNDHELQAACVGRAELDRAAARAWARRWKRAAKDTRGQRQVLQDILNTTTETTNADLKDLRARLEKWRTAERMRLLITDYGERTEPQESKAWFARVPEGEE